jgi:hypothetical protein
MSDGASRDGVFIHLTPPGVRAVVGVASAELSGRVIEFSDIFGWGADLLLKNHCQYDSSSAPIPYRD